MSGSGSFDVALGGLAAARLGFLDDDALHGVQAGQRDFRIGRVEGDEAPGGRSAAQLAEDPFAIGLGEHVGTVGGQAFGLDPAVMTDILNASTGRNNATEVKAKQFMLSGTFAAGFSMGLMVKDLATAASLAESVGARAEFARRCAELWREAAGALGPDADHTEIYRHVGGWRTD